MELLYDLSGPVSILLLELLGGSYRGLYYLDCFLKLSDEYFPVYY